MPGDGRGSDDVGAEQDSPTEPTPLRRLIQRMSTDSLMGNIRPQPPNVTEQYE